MSACPSGLPTGLCVGRIGGPVRQPCPWLCLPTLVRWPLVTLRGSERSRRQRQRYARSYSRSAEPSEKRPEPSETHPRPSEKRPRPSVERSHLLMTKACTDHYRSYRFLIVVQAFSSHDYPIIVA